MTNLALQVPGPWQHDDMPEISFKVSEYPPAKNEAKSMLAAGHPHASRVLALEAKGHRGNLEHLGDLAFVALYANDRQIQEAHYRWLRAEKVRYQVRVWAR